MAQKELLKPIQLPLKGHSFKPVTLGAFNSGIPQGKRALEGLNRAFEAILAPAFNPSTASLKHYRACMHPDRTQFAPLVLAGGARHILATPTATDEMAVFCRFIL